MSKLGQQLNTQETILRHPHVTERSSMLSFNEDHPVYTFVVAEKANKATIKVAVEKLYGVKPLRVNIVNVLPRQIVVRGKRGQKPGFKKAMVFLKKGDKIDFV